MNVVRGMSAFVQVTCLVTDEDTSTLWAGHADGKVSGFSLQPGKCMHARRIAQWQVLACRVMSSEIWLNRQLNAASGYQQPARSRGSSKAAAAALQRKWFPLQLCC